MAEAPASAAETPRPRAPFGRTFLVLAAVSGVAVTLQVMGWTDQARLLFSAETRTAAGAVTLAVCLVAAGVGALVAGRLADRRRDGIRFLAGLHLALGAYTVASPWLVRYPAETVIAVWRAGGMGQARGVLGAGLGFVFLLPGLGLVGGLVPASMRVLAVAWSRLGRTMGRLGGAWLGGLAAGALAWGLGAWSAAGLGITARLWLAAVMHLTAGGLAAVLAGRAPRGHPEEGPGRTGPGRVRRRDRLSQRVRMVGAAGAAAAGLAAGVYRLLLAPLLAAQFAGQPISLALSLGLALAGAALGAVVMGRLIDHRRDRTIWVAGALTVAGLGALWGSASLPAVSGLAAALAFGLDSRLFGEALTVLVTILPAAMCVGALVPALCRVYVTRLAAVGAQCGGLVAAWCAGGVLAAASAIPAALPEVACQGTLLIAGLAVSSIAVALVLVDYGLRSSRRVAGVGVIVAATGAAMLLQPHGVRHGSAAAEGHPVVYYAESPAGVVAVVQSPRTDRWLVVDGRRAGGTPVDWSAPGYALAHVPLTLHANPRSVLVLGERAGQAAAQARLQRLSRLEIVEPMGDLRRAGQWFDEGGDEAPRPTARRPTTGTAGLPESLPPLVGTGPAEVIVHAMMPQAFVAGTDRHYDVVVVEGFPAATPLGGRGYTREGLAGAAEHLGRGGILALRLPIEDLDQGRFRMLIRTFLEALPYAQVWWVPLARREVMLTGARAPVEAGLGRMAARLAAQQVAPALRRAGGDEVLTVADWLVATGPALQEFAGAGRLETRDLPRVAAESAWARWLAPDRPQDRAGILAALAALRATSRQARWAALTSATAGAAPPGDADAAGKPAGEMARAALREAFDRFDRSWSRLVDGHLAELAGQQQTASEHYAAALALNPDHRAAHYLLVQVAGRERADELVRQLTRQVEETAPARRRLAGLYRRLGLLEPASEELEHAVLLAPLDPALWADLGEVTARLDDPGSPGRAMAALTRALDLEPDLARARVERAALSMRLADWRGAEADWQRLIDGKVRGDPLRRAVIGVGLCRLEQGDAPGAVAHLEEAGRQFPDDAEVLTALGRAFLAQGRLSAALQAFREAGSLDPRNEAVRSLLAETERRLETLPVYPGTAPP